MRDEVLVVDGRWFGGTSTNGIGITEIWFIQSKIRIKEVKLEQGEMSDVVPVRTHIGV